jgi:hypothetical protein
MMTDRSVTCANYRRPGRSRAASRRCRRKSRSSARARIFILRGIAQSRGIYILRTVHRVVATAAGRQDRHDDFSPLSITTAPLITRLRHVTIAKIARALKSHFTPGSRVLWPVYYTAGNNVSSKTVRRSLATRVSKGINCYVNDTLVSP